MNFEDQLSPRQSQRHSRSSSFLIPASIVFAGLLIAGSFFYSAKLKREQVAVNTVMPEETEGPDIRPIGPNDHIMGNPNARVVFVEYADFECPFCKRYHGNLQALITRYGQNGDVAWVYRHFPVEDLHKQSFKEAIAAECAAQLGGNEAFWKYADLIFSNTEGRDDLDMNLLPEFADQIGLDTDEFTSCLTNEQTRPMVQEDLDEGLNKTGANGTPHTVVLAGGKSLGVPGLLGLDALVAVVEIALAQLDAME